MISPNAVVVVVAVIGAVDVAIVDDADARAVREQ